MAAHNGQKYIKQQLESILIQLSVSDEIVISDDGSTDATLDVIKEMNDARIKVFHYKQPSKTKHPHEYVCGNFENALIHAKGDFIFLSDQDDEWLPNKVEVCMNDLKKYDLVLHDFSHMDDDGNITKELHYNGSFYPKNYFLVHRGKHYGCAMAFHKKVLQYALPFPNHLMLHDCWIGLLTEALGSFYFEKQTLLKYRIHQQNTSDTQNSIFFKMSYRANNFLNLVARVLKYKFKLKSHRI